MDIVALRDKYSGEIYDFSEVGCISFDLQFYGLLSKNILCIGFSAGREKN